jgi:hypothetical protein
VARPSGTPGDGARSRGPWPNADAGRRTARAACERAATRVEGPRRVLHTVLDLRLRHLLDPEAERDVLVDALPRKRATAR